MTTEATPNYFNMARHGQPEARAKANEALERLNPLNLLHFEEFLEVLELFVQSRQVAHGRQNTTTACHLARGLRILRGEIPASEFDSQPWGWGAHAELHEPLLAFCYQRMVRQIRALPGACVPTAAEPRPPIVSGQE